MRVRYVAQYAPQDTRRSASPSGSNQKWSNSGDIGDKYGTCSGRVRTTFAHPQPDVGRFRLHLDRIRANVGRSRAPGRLGSKFAKFGLTSVEVASMLVDSGPSWPIRAEVAPNMGALGPNSTEFDGLWPHLGQLRPGCGQICTTSTGFGPSRAKTSSVQVAARPSFRNISRTT